MFTVVCDVVDQKNCLMRDAERPTVAISLENSEFYNRVKIII